MKKTFKCEYVGQYLRIYSRYMFKYPNTHIYFSKNIKSLNCGCSTTIKTIKVLVKPILINSNKLTLRVLHIHLKPNWKNVKTKFTALPFETEPSSWRNPKTFSAVPQASGPPPPFVSSSSSSWHRLSWPWNRSSSSLRSCPEPQSDLQPKK